MGEATAGLRRCDELSRDFRQLHGWLRTLRRKRPERPAFGLNTDLTGTFLAHPLADARPAALIIDARYLARFEMLGASAPPIGKLFVAGVENPSGRHPFDRWRSAAALNTPLPLPSDLACIMYTSGKTGPPKGVLMPHAHCYLFGLGVVENLAVSGADHYYVCLPLSHANRLLMQLGAVLIAARGPRCANVSRPPPGCVIFGRVGRR